MKLLSHLLVIFSIPFILLSCSDSKLAGQWEYDGGEVDSYYGKYRLIYRMELDFAERSIAAEDIPNKETSYGLMDFSNMSHIYHNEIDSINKIGDNRYEIFYYNSYSDTMDKDTLIYTPKDKTIRLASFSDGNMVFKKVPDKPFDGVWSEESDDSSVYVRLSLYEKIKDRDGLKCYGWVLFDSDIDESYSIITKVISAKGDRATVELMFPDYEETEPYTAELAYRASDGMLYYDNLPIPCNDKTVIEASTSSEGSNTLIYWLAVVEALMIIGIIVTKTEDDAETGILFIGITSFIYSLLALWVMYDIANDVNIPALKVGQTDGIWSWAFMLYVTVGGIIAYFMGMSLLHKSLCEEDSYFSIGYVGWGIFFTACFALIYSTYGKEVLDYVMNDYIAAVSFKIDFWTGIASWALSLAALLIIVQWIVIIVKLDNPFNWIFAIAYPVYVATAIAFFIAGAYIAIVLIILGCIFGAIFGGKDAPQRSMSGHYEREDSVQPFIPEGETGEVTLEDGTTITKDLIGNSFHDKDLNEYRKNDDGKTFRKV